MSAIALYLRLSMSDGDLGKENKDESNSINGQRALLKTFLKSQTGLFGEVIEYIDDGYTGTNFDRPGFQRLIDDARKGNVKAILVKDLSRLGRDYIGVGDYIEQIFPVLGIRFIAVNNHFDSINYIDKAVGLDMALNNFVNHFYSKDTSKKIKSTFKLKWQGGYSTYGMLPFGYKRDLENKGKWLIDNEAASYVKILFDAAIEGRSTTEIARFLNEKKIPTPGAYNEIHKLWVGGMKVVSDKEKLWSRSMVWRTLMKYEYTGALVVGKRQYVNFGKRITKYLPESEYIITEHAHEAIVSHEEFNIAQSAIRKLSRSGSRTYHNYLLKGKIKCGNCHIALAYQNVRKEPALYCNHGRDIGRDSSCCKDSYNVQTLEARVWHALQNLMRLVKRYEFQMDVQRQDEISSDPLLKKLIHEIEMLKVERIRHYETYADGRMEKKMYLKKRQDLNTKISELEEKHNEIVTESDEKDSLYRNVKDLAKRVDRHSGEVELTKELVDAFIEVIYIYDTKRMEIVFKSDDIIDRMMEDLAS